MSEQDDPDGVTTAEMGSTIMHSFKRKSLAFATGTAITGAVVAGALVAAPAQAAEPAPSSSTADVGGNVNVNLDPVAIVNAIADAVNDQSDRGGAVQAALDVGYWNAGNPDRLTVAVVNKNQDISVQGDVADAQSIDIKGGNYVIYWFKGPGTITNNGDGGWLNWGAFGNIERIDNVIHVNGG